MNGENPKVFLNKEGIIEFIWNGDLEWKAYVEALQYTYQLAMELESQGRSVNMIVDFARLGKLAPPGPQIAVRSLKDIPYRRIAGFGVKPEHQPILDAIKEETRENKGVIRDFATREEALVWVKEG